MSDERSKNHVVVTVSVKRVEFVPLAPSVARNVMQTAGASAETRVVTDLLAFSVEKARESAIAMLKVINDETPGSTFKHEKMREAQA